MKNLKKIILDEIKNVLLEKDTSYNFTGNFCSDPKNEGKSVPELPGFICKKGNAVNTGILLQRGSSGINVVRLQSILKKLGYGRMLGTAGVDGKFGRRTQASLKDFQENNGVTRNDGALDEETMKKLTETFTEVFLGSAAAFSIFAAEADGAIAKTKNMPDKSLAASSEYATARTIKQCPAIPGTLEQNRKYLQLSQQLMAPGSDIPVRSACEIAYVKVRPEYAGRAFFIIDTKDKIIYLYSKEGKYVAKSGIVSGKNAQSQNKEMIAKALKSGIDIMKEKGYVFNTNDKSYYKDGKKIGNEEAYWEYLRAIDKMKTRFIPQGVYDIAYGQVDKHEVGADTGDNAFRLRLGNIILNQAIHGYFNEPKRRDWFAKVKNKYKMDSNTPGIEKEYLKFIRSNVGRFQGGYGSFGCINVSIEFLVKMRPHALGAAVFVLGEQNENFLVQNSSDFFNRSSEMEEIQQYAYAYPAKIDLNNPQEELPGQVEKAYV